MWQSAVRNQRRDLSRFLLSLLAMPQSHRNGFRILRLGGHEGLGLLDRHVVAVQRGVHDHPGGTEDAAVEMGQKMPVDEATWQSFAQRLNYVSANFDDGAGYLRLKETLESFPSDA